MKTSLLTLLLFIGFTSLCFAQGTTCSNASTINFGPDCFLSPFTLSGGNSGQGTASCVSGTINHDGWYQFTATNTSTTIRLINASNNVAIVVYSGTCGALTEEDCNDQGSNFSYLEVPTFIGNTYFIQIISTSNIGGSTTGDFCATSNVCVEEVLVDEQFNNSQVQGAITANLFGTGSSGHQPTWVMSGTRFGWFNVRNGLTNVDFYDRSGTVMCTGSPVEVSFWTRRSFGTTNVTFSIIDDNSVVLASTTLNLTSNYQQISLNFISTTTDFRFVAHLNNTGGSGVDIVMEDLFIKQCLPCVIFSSELTDFNVNCSNDKVKLNWETLTEQNNSHFTIERSKDAINFEEIAFIEAAGKSTVSKRYFWVDESPLSGLSYYRLKQTEIDGFTETLQIKAINCNQDSKTYIYPNPFNDNIRVNAKHDGVLKLYDITGRIIISRPIHSGITVLDLSFIPSGTFFTQLELINGTVHQDKIIKIN